MIGHRGEALAATMGAIYVAHDDHRDGAPVVEEAARRLGGLDGVVLNAGTIVHARLDDTTPAQLAEVLRVNVTVPVTQAQTAAALMPAGSAIVAVASNAGAWGETEIGAYSVSKAAMLAACRALAAEYGRRVFGSTRSTRATPSPEWPRASMRSATTRSRVAPARSPRPPRRHRQRGGLPTVGSGRLRDRRRPPGRRRHARRPRRRTADVTGPTGREVLVCGGDDTLVETLRALGWTPADPHATTPLGLLVIAPAPQDDGDGTWSATGAMEATAAVIGGIVDRRDRLRSGAGLVVVAVPTPPGRAAVRSAGDGIVAAALAMSVQVLAVDWARDGVRCLLVVTGGDAGEPLARIVHWLAAPDAPALTGQTIDMAAVAHATLSAPGT